MERVRQNEREALTLLTCVASDGSVGNDDSSIAAADATGAAVGCGSATKSRTAHAKKKVASTQHSPSALPESSDLPNAPTVSLSVRAYVQNEMHSFA